MRWVRFPTTSASHCCEICFFEVQKWTLFASLLSVTSFFNFLILSKAESYARLWQNNHFIFFVWYGDHTYQKPGIYTAAAVCTAAAVVYSRYPDRNCCSTKKVTPSEPSQRHHLPERAASAHAARARCFDPKRAATAPGFRAYSASREHRVGSLY